MSAVALLGIVVEVASLLPHATKIFKVLLPMTQVSFLYAV
jgi:hypothetical protein